MTPALTAGWYGGLLAPAVKTAEGTYVEFEVEDIANHSLIRTFSDSRSLSVSLHHDHALYLTHIHTLNPSLAGRGGL